MVSTTLPHTIFFTKNIAYRVAVQDLYSGNKMICFSPVAEPVFTKGFVVGKFHLPAMKGSAVYLIDNRLIFPVVIN